MATISVYDYDYFNYEHVIPNLECAKLITYFRKHRDVAILTPILNPSKYTKCYIRKEYDDGIYLHDFFLPNCEYGGKAFNPELYVPLPPEIENTIPNMSIYEQYADRFGKTKTDMAQLKRLLNCAHIRLSTDSVNLNSIEQLKKNFNNKTSGIILHDYDISKLDIYDTLTELQNQRYFKFRDEIKPIPIGNKYPIKLYNKNDFYKWIKLVAIPNAFFMEYCGLMEDRLLYNVCYDNKRIAKQLYYNITHGCKTEEEFIARLPQIYLQALFLKRQDIKMLLIYNEQFLKTKELQDLIDLFNYMIHFKWQDNFKPQTQTLAELCKGFKKLQFKTWAFYTIKLDIQDIRNSFNFIRAKNYELFKMFYNIDAVHFEGGKFVDDWARN